MNAAVPTVGANYTRENRQYWRCTCLVLLHYSSSIERFRFGAWVVARDRAENLLILHLVELQQISIADTGVMELASVTIPLLTRNAN